MKCSQDHPPPVCASCPSRRLRASYDFQSAVTHACGYPTEVLIEHTDMCQSELPTAAPTRAPQMNPHVRRSPDPGRRPPDSHPGERRIPDPYPPGGWQNTTSIS
ncbi:hypothetical protein PCANC_16001 [Puccinia coronata f. sp. avenae]|uniref:Uncharacterized protein n=1 Tax=Puccinia coronata f. sp. avenae TaxID=200324 RepID=A0A2N5VRX6_9BASI|nr:hypothetical protein PCANC_16001 [Puccinia coronata f. sp. avenae]